MADRASGADAANEEIKRHGTIKLKTLVDGLRSMRGFALLGDPKQTKQPAGSRCSTRITLVNDNSPMSLVEEAMNIVAHILVEVRHPVHYYMLGWSSVAIFKLKPVIFF